LKPRPAVHPAQARRIAANIAKLPNLLTMPRCDNEVGRTGLDFGDNFGVNQEGRMDLWWAILSVLAPVIFVALLGTTVLYALSRKSSHRQ
jgi:hypothetical protein